MHDVYILFFLLADMKFQCHQETPATITYVSDAYHDRFQMTKKVNPVIIHLVDLFLSLKVQLYLGTYGICKICTLIVTSKFCQGPYQSPI